MSNSVMYSKNFVNRFIFDIYFAKERKQCIFDTASANTLIPLALAKKFGKKTKVTATVIVGGKNYQATLYLFKNITIGDFNIDKMVAFASDYKGILEDRVLLGLNVINSLEITLLSRSNNKILFNYKPWYFVKDEKHPFCMYFKDTGSLPTYFEE